MSVFVYALLVDQSNSTFISESAMQRFNADGPAVKIELATIWSEQIIDNEIVYGLSVSNIRDGTCVSLPVTYVCDSIPADRDLIPCLETACRWNHLRSIADQIKSWSCVITTREPVIQIVGSP